jgi:hypothetical protein
MILGAEIWHYLAVIEKEMKTVRQQQKENAKKKLELSQK